MVFQIRSAAKTQVGRPMVKNLCPTHVVAAAAPNSPLCQAKSVRRSWPDLDIEVETTALHGRMGGLAIHLLVNPDPGFRWQALRMIEVSTDRLWPETWSPARCWSLCVGRRDDLTLTL